MFVTYVMLRTTYITDNIMYDVRQVRHTPRTTYIMYNIVKLLKYLNVDFWFHGGHEHGLLDKSPVYV